MCWHKSQKANYIHHGPGWERTVDVVQAGTELEPQVKAGS